MCKVFHGVLRLVILNAELLQTLYTLVVARKRRKLLHAAKRLYLYTRCQKIQHCAALYQHNAKHYQRSGAAAALIIAQSCTWAAAIVRMGVSAFGDSMWIIMGRALDWTYASRGGIMAGTWRHQGAGAWAAVHECSGWSHLW